MIFCTVSDKNYLSKGLAMYESIIEANQEDLQLFYLAMDEFTYEYLSSLELENLTPIRLSSLENMDPALKKAKSNPASKYGDQYSQYCWALAPYFTNFCLKFMTRENEYMAYLDADLYFYKPFAPIFSKVSGYSIGIHTHRFSGAFRDQDNGWYNVGVVIFKKDKTGLEASESWKNWLLDPGNQYYEKYGTCGDQKYLELFPKLYGQNVCIFDADKEILHGAPWCCNDLSNRLHEVYWYHFSHFRYDKDGNWHDSLHGEWNPAHFVPSLYGFYSNIIMYHDKKISEYGIS